MDLQTQAHLAMLRQLLLYRQGELRAEVHAAQLSRQAAQTDAPEARGLQGGRRADAAPADGGLPGHRATCASLHDVDDALGRLDAGTFGDCAGCGEAIPAARLIALPSVRAVHVPARRPRSASHELEHLEPTSPPGTGCGQPWPHWPQVAPWKVQNTQARAQTLARQALPDGELYIGWRVFQQKCAGCHGTAATGMANAPDLLAKAARDGARTSFASLVLRRYNDILVASESNPQSTDSKPLWPRKYCRARSRPW